MTTITEYLPVSMSTNDGDFFLSIKKHIKSDANTKQNLTHPNPL